MSTKLRILMVCLIAVKCIFLLADDIMPTEKGCPAQADEMEIDIVKIGYIELYIITKSTVFVRPPRPESIKNSASYRLRLPSVFIMTTKIGGLSREAITKGKPRKDLNGTKYAEDKYEFDYRYQIDFIGKSDNVIHSLCVNKKNSICMIDGAFVELDCSMHEDICRQFDDIENSLTRSLRGQN